MPATGPKDGKAGAGAGQARPGRVVGIARREETRAPMELLDEAVIDLELGVLGDAKGKRDGRQVTVLGREAWQQACAELGETLPWTTRRANLLIEGVDLAESVGVHLQVGDAVLEITEETAPCSRMDGQHEGLRSALAPEWRGGVSCKVIEAGLVRMDDEAVMLRG